MLRDTNTFDNPLMHRQPCGTGGDKYACSPEAGELSTMDVIEAVVKREGVVLTDQ